SRSTASIFQPQNIEKTLAEQRAAQPPQIIPENTGSERDIELENAGFPFNVIYRVQDYVSENINFLLFVQLLVFSFILQLVILHRSKFDHLDANMYPVAFNWAGILSALILNYIKSEKKPKDVPEFNYLYSIFFPFLINLVHYDADWFLANLALNYFIVDKLNPIFRVFSAVGFYEVYNESTKLDTFSFIQICAFQYLNSFVLNYINDFNIPTIDEENEDQYRTFSKAEIQIISLLLTNLFFNKDFVSQYLPLAIFQKLLISFILSILALYYLHQFLPSVVSMVAFSGIFYGLTIFQLNYVLGGQNAVSWLYDYIFLDEEKTQILQVWSAILLVTIPTTFFLVDKLGFNIRRKIWHFVIIGILGYRSEVLMQNIEFTLISLLGSIVVFLVVELVRFNRITFIGQYLAHTLAKFQDKKDLKGPLNVSYIYLIVGATIPIVYDYILFGAEHASVIRYMGIIALGLGDSMASIIGQSFGSYKWKGSDKSVQGSIAFVVATFSSFVALDYALTEYAGEIYVPVGNWENLLVSTLVCAVLEGTSNLNDNFFVPILLPLQYELLNRCFP
ncbi:dolichol kinase, partial [Scheffersomyces stipitis CBS 6054]